MTVRSIPALLVVMLATSPALAAGPKEWDKSFKVAARPSVDITTNDGRVRVRTGPVGQVSAHVRFDSHVWGWTSPSREPEVDLHQNGDAITVLAKEPSAFMVVGGISMKLEIEVIVPVDCDLEIQSGDGSVKVEDPVRGRLDVDTGDGSIVVRGARGDVRLSTGDGGIDADSLDGSVSARSGDGHVDLTGRFDRLEVRTADGRVVANATHGSKLAEGWRLETGDGSLTLRIPRNLAAELDAHTGDGRIHFDLPVAVSGPLDPHRVRGLLNGGGPPLRMRTGDGSLTLSVSD